jgi:hypothetical protein
MPFPKERADALAAKLELDVSKGVCQACLSFVSFALDGGDPADIARQTRAMTPVLWDEGVSDQALAAVRRASEHGVLFADVALAELERNGGRSVVARAIVQRLARDLSRRTRMELHLEAAARDRLRLAPPELN